MRILFCVALIFVTSALRAAETAPSWPELESLFGTPVEGPAVKKFTAAHPLTKAAKGDSGSLAPKNQSYSIMFTGNRVDCVILHLGPSPKEYGDSNAVAYESDLPFGLKRLHTRKDVIGLLGEPDTPSGSFWQLNGCEIRVSFSKSTGLIQEVYIWKKDKARTKTSK
jgi:hypothetical protein